MNDGRMTREPTHNERVLLQGMLLVFDQHAGCDHKCMQAGQNAAILLWQFGLCADTGRDILLTDAGRALLEGPVLDLELGE